MNEGLNDNHLKYLNYKEQFKRLNKALVNGFNLEAIFIEYAIMEDRTESILRHGGYWDAYLKKLKGRDPAITSKIRYIQGKANSGDKLLHKHFSDDMLEQIIAWKDERNRLIHALLKQQLAHNEVAELAEQGNELVKELRNRAGKYNRAVDKQREQATA